jgi:hypothetical protein
MTLSTRERAFAVAAVRALGARAEAVCARRSPELRRFAAGLAKDAARLASEGARLGKAIPDGIEAVHPSWYERPLVSRKPPASGWLSRRTFGHLVDMEHAEADPFNERSSDELARMIVALGRRRVAIAFSGAPRGALAQLCARLGEPAGSQLVDEVRHIAQLVLPADVTAAQQALHHSEDSRHDLFTQAGVAWLAPALAASGGDRLQRIAQRLPRVLGELLLEAAVGQPNSKTDNDAVGVAVQLLGAV